MTNEKQDILDLADRIEKLPAYSADKLGIGYMYNGQDVSDIVCCLLINEKWREVIVSALRALER